MSSSHFEIRPWSFKVLSFFEGLFKILVVGSDVDKAFEDFKLNLFEIDICVDFSFLNGKRCTMV